MRRRRGQDPTSPTGVLLFAGVRNGLVIADLEAPDLETSWDRTMRDAWNRGFRGMVYFECPDVLLNNHALYLL